MRQYTRLLRIALSILGSFLLAFMVLGLVFTFRIKKSTVTAEAKSLVENLGTKSEIDAASELAALQQTEVQTQAAGLEQAETQNLAQNEGQTQELVQGTEQTQVDPAQGETTAEAANSVQAQVQDQNQEQAQIENGQESGTSLDTMIAQLNEELDVLITKIPEVAATLPKQVVIFTGLNDCNHYTEIADYRRDYVTMLQQLKASIPGVKIIVSSLLSPSDALGQVRADLVRAPQFDQELRSICQENDVTYVDSTWIVRQKNYLDDGIHMNRTFYRVWFRYLKALLGNQ